MKTALVIFNSPSDKNSSVKVCDQLESIGHKVNFQICSVYRNLSELEDLLAKDDYDYVCGHNISAKFDYEQNRFGHLSYGP